MNNALASHDGSHQLLAITGAIVLVVVALDLVELAFKWLPAFWKTAVPVRMVRARVVARSTLGSNLVTGAIGGSQIDLLVTFFFDGQNVELCVPYEVYLKATNGCTGLLTYQGNKAVDFKPLI